MIALEYIAYAYFLIVIVTGLWTAFYFALDVDTFIGMENVLIIDVSKRQADLRFQTIKTVALGLQKLRNDEHTSSKFLIPTLVVLGLVFCCILQIYALPIKAKQLFAKKNVYHYTL